MRSNAIRRRRRLWWLVPALIAGCVAAPEPETVGTTSGEAAAVDADLADGDDANAAIAASVPSTDIVLVPLAQVLAGTPPQTVTAVARRPGYDNQPAFDAQGRSVYFSSIVGAEQSDVFRFDLASGKTAQVTRTPQSEYSPTPLAGGGFSCVQVALDGTQRLWRYGDDGTPAAAIRPDITGVGYHAWLSRTLLALFIVDEPLRLELVNLAGGAPVPVATNVGRSLHRTAAGALAYVRKDADGAGTVHEMDPASGRDRSRAALPGPGEDLVWLADGSALVAAGRTLHRLAPGASRWEALVDLSSTVDGDITRMAVDPAGRWLALVVAESAG